jgi:transposase
VFKADARGGARCGSTPKLGPSIREQICRTAKSDPARLGCPFTCWSLTELRDYLAEAKCIWVSHETIRQVLRRAGISLLEHEDVEALGRPGLRCEEGAHTRALRLSAA